MDKLQNSRRVLASYPSRNVVYRNISVSSSLLTEDCSYFMPCQSNFASFRNSTVGEIQLLIQIIIVTITRWTVHILLQGKRRELEIEDLPPTRRENSAECVGNTLLQCWNKEKLKENPSLWRALMRVHAWSYSKTFFCLLIQQCGLRHVETKLESMNMSMVGFLL